MPADSVTALLAAAAPRPLLAAAAATANPLNVSGIDAILGSVLGAVLLLVAIRTVLHALKAGWALALTATGIVMLGVMLYGFATSGDIGALGGDLFHAIVNV